jgi:hypothetical protein
MTARRFWSATAGPDRPPVAPCLPTRSPTGSWGMAGRARPPGARQRRSARGSIPSPEAGRCVLGLLGAPERRSEGLGRPRGTSRGPASIFAPVRACRGTSDFATVYTGRLAAPL